MRRVSLEDFERGPLLGIGGFGRWDVFDEDGAVDEVVIIIAFER